MEDKTFYSLEKVFNRIIERYLSIYSAKNYPASTSKATLKSGTHSPNGLELNSSKIASSLFQTIVLSTRLSSIHLTTSSRR